MVEWKGKGKKRGEGKKGGGEEDTPKAATPPLPKWLTQPGRAPPSPSIRTVARVSIRPQVTWVRCVHWMRIVHVPVSRRTSFF